MRILLTLFLLVTGCGLFPQEISLDDPEVKELLLAAEKFPRQAYGYSRLPTDSNTRIFISRRSNPSYDVMLYVKGKSNKTIAFQKTVNGYIWVHEQEIFEGPNTYDHPDGTFQETISLTYETQKVAGTYKDGINIIYCGDDPRLSKKWDLSPNDVIPIIKEWGYRKK